MFLPPTPTIVLCAQIQPLQNCLTTVYDLRHVSPAYFLQELDSPRKPRRPAGVASIISDDVRSIITVKATPAGHTALKSLLEQIDILRKPFEQPRYIQLYLHGTKDAKQAALPIFAATDLQIKKKGEVLLAQIIAYAKDALAEFHFDELQAQEQTLSIRAHFSADEKTARLEYFLRIKGNLQPSLIPLGTQTVTVGERTKMVLDKPLRLADADEFFVRVRRVTNRQ